MNLPATVARHGPRVTEPGRPTRRVNLGTNTFPGLLTVLTVLLVGTPLGVLLLSAVKPSTALPFDDVPLTGENLQAVFGQAVTYQLLARTVQFATGSVALALVIAFAAAWLVERTTVPGRGVIRTLMVLQMAIPGILIAFAWTLLASPRSGVLNTWLRPLLGASGQVIGPFDAYSMAGMIFVTGLLLAPTTFFMLAGFLRRLDVHLEESAAMSGASPFQILRRVTGPLLSPALLSIVLFQLVILIQYFEVPLALGLPGNTLVLSTRIYLLARPNPGLPEYGLAAAFGCIALLVAALLMGAYLRATRHVESYRTVTGKSFQVKRSPAGRWAVVAVTIVGVHFLCGLVLPLLILLWTSLLPVYAPPSMQALSSLGFKAYETALSINGLGPAILNTLLMIATTATITVTWATLVALFSTRRRASGTRLLEFVAFLPAAIPGVAIALAVMLFSIRTPLYGTIWMIVLGQFIAYLAYGSRTMSSAVLQIHPELGEAAHMSGANWLQTQWRVILPLLAPTAGSTWIWVLTHSLRDFTFPVILATTGNMVLSSLIWQVWSRPDQSTAAAMSIVLVAVLTLVVALGRQAFTRDERL